MNALILKNLDGKVNQSQSCCKGLLKLKRLVLRNHGNSLNDVEKVTHSQSVCYNCLPTHYLTIPNKDQS